MKNTLMLIAVVIVLILALTACGKIETEPQGHRDAIKREALKLLELPDDTQSDLFFIESTTDNGYTYDTYIFVYAENEEQKGYELVVMRNSEFAILKFGIGEQVEIRIGTSNDLWGTDK